MPVFNVKTPFLAPRITSSRLGRISILFRGGIHQELLRQKRLSERLGRGAPEIQQQQLSGHQYRKRGCT